MNAARWTGATYLFVILTPIVSLVLVDARLIVKGDAAATAANLGAHPLLFRVGLTMEVAMFAAVLLLAALHHILLREVDRNVSQIALVFRASEAVIGLGTVLAGSALLGATDARMTALLLEVRAFGMDIALVLMSVGAILFCALFYAARIVPRALAAYGLGCYGLILVASFVNLLAPAYRDSTMLVFVPGTLFEIAIGWFLLRARRSPALTDPNEGMISGRDLAHSLMTQGGCHDTHDGKYS